MSVQSDANKYISAQITQRLRSSRNGQKWWSFATHGATVLIVVFSATSAVLAQTTDLKLWISSNTWATILSLLVTYYFDDPVEVGF
jgi:hypothetical protein